MLDRIILFYRGSLRAWTKKSEKATLHLAPPLPPSEEKPRNVQMIDIGLRHSYCCIMCIW